MEKVRWLRAHPAEVALMRAQARKEYETKYTGEENYAQMIQIYESVLSPGFPAGPARPTNFMRLSVKDGRTRGRWMGRRLY